MRPLFYSEKEAKTHKIGWQRIGDQIKYYKNNVRQDGGRHFFSLTWTFQFPHNKDTCYFAHCYPYTYTNLQEYLSAVSNDPVRSKFCKIRVLCHTLARNMVYVLTITTPLKNTDSRKRKAVILTARVHPGETNSSWIMKGFLDYILGDSSDAQLLRDTFIFKVVPMLNPDGVIVGNYRCSLAGRDLNRNYTSLLKESFPSVWYTRNMIHRLMEKREVILYCDLHGHSRKQNIFMYGCDGSNRSKGKGLYLQQRIFPLMLSKNCPNQFSFSGCKFKVQKSKEGTGRVVMWKMGIRNSFTLEATFCGSTLGNKRGTHFSTKDLESMGYHFCDSLLDYCDPDRSKKKHLKTKKERNATIASHQNDKKEVYGKEHLLPRHKESNSDVKDTRLNTSDDYMVGYFRQHLPSQGLDSHHRLKSNMKSCTSFQDKKTGINWTDDEKRIYRDKRKAQTQEILQCFLPIMETFKSLESPQMKDIFSPSTSTPTQPQPNSSASINGQRYSTSWTPPSFKTKMNLGTNASEWFQSVPQRSFESLSPLQDPKKRKKHSQNLTKKTEDTKPLCNKWETIPSSSEGNAVKDKSLHAEDPNLTSCKQIVHHAAENKGEKPKTNGRQLTSHLKPQRDS
uniref:cytosolic carboxypeptidase 3 n=1 Tax=Jaculus jaculus TaxID=51337 RepID=UPI001E1B1ABC|nr:cytosolic carboxypeptidase 3 [Jaculus jaculus]